MAARARLRALIGGKVKRVSLLFLAACPLFAADTASVLSSELGLTGSQLDELAAAGVIALSSAAVAAAAE